jgi:GNAT superfamily N-acetyltransferase
MSEPVIRAARPGDEDTILALLHELAVYERLDHRFQLTRETIARDMLCEVPRLCVDLALLGGEPAGLMSWYWTYSSFAAACGIYLEDFYVRGDLRGRGIGRKLLARLARRGLEEGAVRIDWAVLDWNRPSIEFYERLHAERIDEWHVYRLTGDALAGLARS